MALVPPHRLGFLNTLRKSLMISLHKIILRDGDVMCACLPMCMDVCVFFLH